MLTYSLALTAAALVIEAVIGYPPFVLRAIGHPVIWIGAMIGRLDRVLNRDQDPEQTRLVAGVASIAAIVFVAGGAGWLLQLLLPGAVLAILASALLAQRSLFAHVRDVEIAMRRDGVAGGRVAVARIVGRDPAALDAAGISRAAIESLAENFSDGVVAPALWCALGGLPGMAIYKAVNTADSMIGHRSTRHAAFGWASARLDDVINLPASRLSAVWIVAASLLHPDANAARAWHTTLRDAGHHRSPNAGWPEAAMAGALGLRLAGPRVYGGANIDDAWMGDGRAECGPADIARALSLYRTACALQIIAFVVLAVSLLV